MNLAAKSISSNTLGPAKSPLIGQKLCGPAKSTLAMNQAFQKKLSRCLKATPGISLTGLYAG
jgi:hypothetical protein